MVMSLERLPSYLQNTIKELRLSTIKQIDVVPCKGCIEVSVSGVDSQKKGFLKIICCSKERE